VDTVIERAVDDATALERAGFDAVIVENFGDVPFVKDAVQPITIASMALAVAKVVDQLSIPVGVNVLRNDALGALAIAAAAGASFIRVNVLSGVMFTDQGIIEGRADELARTRAELGPQIQVFADVFVKHAVPPVGLELVRAAEDLAFRAGADALILSGSSTGTPTDLGPVGALRAACPQVPLLVGSGATTDSVAELLEQVDGVIVGTAIEVDGHTANPVDPDRAARFVRAARAGR
jgi:hypothetical protein